METHNPKRMKFTSFDESTSIETLFQKPSTINMLEQKNILAQIPRGGGWSYAAASIGKNDLVTDTTLFNKILEFDEAENTVIVESGVTLRRLLEWGLTKKLFYPVLPGFPEITIGGCIAGNVHGKNPLKDGTFKEHLLWIELYHPRHGYQKIEPNSQIFDATCGGIGLTGFITKAKLQLYSLPSDRIKIVPTAVNSLKDATLILEKNKDADIAYSWHNGSSYAHFEEGVVRICSFEKGFHEKESFIPTNPSRLPKSSFPKSFWGKFTTARVNSFGRNIELKQGIVTKNIFQGFFPFTQKAKWFYFLYGGERFRVYQILVPNENIKKFLDDLTELIKDLKPNLTIIVLKPFRGDQKFLQFCGNGMSVILEIKNSISDLNFLSKLDELTIYHHAIPYIIKDSRLSKRITEECYPEYAQFKEFLKKIDPDRIFKSEISQRLDL